jgi:hypothetical protein
MFFLTCALFDIRKREHALGILGFAMEAIGVFVFRVYIIYIDVIRVSFEGGGPMLKKGGT